MDYEFDIFVSYPRAGHVGPWVQNHFLPVLRHSLDAELSETPRIFADIELPTGTRWEASIKNALLTSRLMVAVWTPPYFRSRWCMAEWESMLEREKSLAEDGRNPERGLVYPVIFSDGKHFDDRARATQYGQNLSNFTYPYKCFRESTLYLEFHNKIKTIAQEVDNHLEQIPDWQPNWPVKIPEPIPETQVNLVGI